MLRSAAMKWFVRVPVKLALDANVPAPAMRAFCVLATYGMTGASTVEVARALGVSRQAVYKLWVPLLSGDYIERVAAPETERRARTFYRAKV